MTRARCRAEKTARRFRNVDMMVPFDANGWSGGGFDAPDVEQLEAERLDALEHPVQGGLIDDAAPEERLGGCDGRIHALEGVEEGGTHAATDGDDVVGWFHALSVGITRMTGHRTM